MTRKYSAHTIRPRHRFRCSRRLLTRLGLFLGLFLGTLLVILTHAGGQPAWANPTPNPQIGIVNSFDPISNPPGVQTTYRLTLRNSSGSPVNIVQISEQTLPGSPGAMVFRDASTVLTNTCGSTITITEPGSFPGTPGRFAVSGGTIPAGSPVGECVIELPVKAFSEGNHIARVLAGNLETSIGSNRDPSNATLEILPSAGTTIAKSFSVNTIPGNGRSLVTVRITNPNQYALTGATLTDALPSSGANQLTVDTRSGAPSSATTCGGTVSISSDSTAVTLSGGTIPARGNCQVTFPVTQANGGSYTNTIPTGSLQTDNRISNRNDASDTLNVQTQVTLAKDMVAVSLSEGDTTQLIVTVRNGGSALTKASGALLTDNLPTPLVVADIPNATTNCTSTGASLPLSATAGANSFALSNANVQGADAQIPASDASSNSLGSCTISITIKADPKTIGNLGSNSLTVTNQFPAGAIQSDQGRTNADPASDTVKVQPALTVTKSYTNGNRIAPGSTAQVTIEVRNSSSQSATGVGFTDNLPSSGGKQLVVSNPVNPSVSSGCGGGSLTATAGNNSVSFSNGAIAPGATCQIRFDVFAPADMPVDANLDNIIADNTVANNQGFDSDGVTGTEGRLQVKSRVEVTKAFNANEIRRGQSSLLIIRIRNNRRSASGSSEPLTQVTITDVLPANLQVATPADFTTNRCNASSTPTFTDQSGNSFGPGDTAFTMTGGSIAPITVCEISFRVTEIDLDYNSPGNATPRTYPNETSNFTNAEGEPAVKGTATLRVISPFRAIKRFESAQITAGGISTAIIELDNAAPFDLTNVTFTDSWTQANVVIANPANATTTCTKNGTISPTIAANPGTRALSISGAVLDRQVGGVFGKCTVRFDVQMSGASPSTFVNTVPAGGITTSERFTNPTAATATLTRVVANLTVVKNIVPSGIIAGDPATVTVTIKNPSSGIPVTNLGFVDTMPPEMRVFPVTGSNTTTCSGGTLAAAVNTNTFRLTGGKLNPGEECQVAVRVTLNKDGTYTNVLPDGGITTKENASNSKAGQNLSAEAALNALPAISVSKQFSPNRVDGGIPSVLTITIANAQTTRELAEPITGIAVTDNLPNLVLVANPADATTNCPGATLTATPGSGTISMTGASLSSGAACTVQVKVVSGKRGTYTNKIEPGQLTGTMQAAIGATATSNVAPAQAQLVINTDARDPNLLLVKRITHVNGSDIAGFNDGSGNADNDPDWPSPTSASLRGELEIADLRPNDVVEYTIYYLNTGDGQANNVLICDRIPLHTTFIPTAFNTGGPAPSANGLPGADRGIVLRTGSTEVSLTNAADSDSGYFFPANVNPQGTFASVSCGGSNNTGAVVVRVDTVPNATGPGTPAASYGYLRFRTRIE